MSGSKLLRLRVLAAFKDLHLARLQVFKGDARALEAGRAEINENFRKNRDVTDPEKIEELITIAVDSAQILRKHVVQIEGVAENQFRANITKDTFMLDNTEYRDVSEKELLDFKKKSRKPRSKKTK
ncbi:complex III assembly factor LYRM7-like [Ciona intestinalis]|uniref:complex III assembly factor LYRM7-like n=1 Tax=Ciona intestinalis TaxID=7719 RepID=UPI000EF50BD7|nr:complex III assembly factor LYRM7-like [Ciona intestinalis]|eukprot:XP_026692697.1 complex III assembly factor LYRM7-like [Ciona intestinalis]